MEVDPETCAPTADEDVPPLVDVDPLDVIAGAAAVAARAEWKRGLTGGRNVCWLQGCSCEDVEGGGIPRDRIDDAMHIMQREE